MPHSLLVVSVITILSFAQLALTQNPPSSTDLPGVSSTIRRDSAAMVENLSVRAKRVVFIAHRKAGKAGANMIGLDHLLQAIVIEDQGSEQMAKVGVKPLPGAIGGHVVESPPEPFLSPELAEKILTKIDATSTHGVPTSADLPVSADFHQTLFRAVELMHETKAEQVEPLHLLAAALEESSRGVEVFKEFGVTKEKVLTAIRRTK